MDSIKSSVPDKTAEKILENVFPVTQGIIGIGWHQIGDEQQQEFILAMEEYANLRTASLIQTIENRIAELEEERNNAQYDTDHEIELGIRITDLKEILKTIKP